jgi:hypothetical protein
MDEELLRCLLAAFPTTSPRPRRAPDDDSLVIRGYRVPFESPVDDVMLNLLAEMRRQVVTTDFATGPGKG